MFGMRLMIRDNDHARCFAAIGKRNAERRGGGESSCDAWNDFKIDSGSLERIDLFREASEDARIAALEANHFQAAARCFLHPRIYFRLGPATGTEALADADHLGLLAGQRKDRRRHKIVMQNDAGARDQAVSPDGKQLRVGGAGADEIDFAFCHLCDWWIAFHILAPQTKNPLTRLTAGQRELNIRFGLNYPD